jgi:hypothetical protein
MGKDAIEAANNAEPVTPNVIELAAIGRGSNTFAKPVALAAGAKSLLDELAARANVVKNVGPIRLVRKIGRDVLATMPTNMGLKIQLDPVAGQEKAPVPVGYFRYIIRLSFPDLYNEIEEMRANRPAAADKEFDKRLERLTNREASLVTFLKTARRIEMQWHALEVAGYAVTLDHLDDDYNSQPFMVIDQAKVGMPIACSIPDFLKLKVEPNKLAKDLVPPRKSRKPKTAGTAATVSTKDGADMALDPVGLLNRNHSHLITLLDGVNTYLSGDDYEKAASFRNNQEVVAACRRAIIGLGVVLGEKPDAMQMFYAADDEDAGEVAEAPKPALVK